MYHIMIYGKKAFVQLIKSVISHSGYLTSEAIIYEYQSLDELLTGISGRHCCDLLFFDMDVEGKDCLSAIKTFRRNFSSATLVLFLEKSELSIEVFDVMPFRCLLKDYPWERMLQEIQIIFRWVNENMGEPYIWGQRYRDAVRVKAGDILYIENTKHGSCVHARRECMVPPFENGILSKEKLDSLYAKLKNFGFAYPHNSYLVNMHYVEKVRKGMELELSDGTNLSISRSKAKEFWNQLTEYIKWKQ